jgi:hypothetical protein
MPKSRTPAIPKVIDKVEQANAAVAEAKAAYQEAQNDLLKTLRWARDNGETLDNLADTLRCTKQWIHRWTSYGHDHNSAYIKVPLETV